MALKDIMLIVDMAEKPSAATDIAVELARVSDAHLTGFALAVDPIVPGLIVAPIPIELIEATRVEAAKLADDGIRRFEAAASRAVISHESRVAEVLMGGIPQAYVAATRLTDLVIVGQDGPDHREPLREVLIETALYEGIAPVLLVPYIAKGALKTDKVVVAWDGSRQAARAVHAAMPLFTKSTEITILMIGSATRQPGEPGADLATWMARHGLNVTIRVLPGGGASVGDTLLNHVSDYGIDLVVMGAYGHSWVREAFLGGATRDILRTMTVPVLMAH